MSDEKNMTRVGFEAPAETVERVKRKTEWGGMSEKLRERLHEIAYGTEVTERKRLRENLEDLRKDKREVEQEIENLRHQRDEFEREIKNIEERLDVLMDNDGEYDGFLQALESDLRDGKRVDPGHGKVERAAELGECAPTDVIEALQERNPDIPDAAFQLPKQGESANWKHHTNQNNTA